VAESCSSYFPPLPPTNKTIIILIYKIFCKRCGGRSRRSVCPVFLSLCLRIIHRGTRRMIADRQNAVVARRFGFVCLAGTDDLAVRGLEVEHVFARGRLLALKERIVAGVLPDGLDPIQARGLGLVALAGKNGLAIAGLQPEPELTGL